VNDLEPRGGAGVNFTPRRTINLNLKSKSMKRSFTQTGKAIKITSDSAVLRPSVGGDFGSNYLLGEIVHNSTKNI